MPAIAAAAPVYIPTGYQHYFGFSFPTVDETITAYQPETYIAVVETSETDVSVSTIVMAVMIPATPTATCNGLYPGLTSNDTASCLLSHLWWELVFTCNSMIHNSVRIYMTVYVRRCCRSRVRHILVYANAAYKKLRSSLIKSKLGISSHLLINQVPSTKNQTKLSYIHPFSPSLTSSNTPSSHITSIVLLPPTSRIRIPVLVSLCSSQHKKGLTIPAPGS